jgi:hypothetical protein
LKNALYDPHKTPRTAQVAQDIKYGHAHDTVGQDFPRSDVATKRFRYSEVELRHQGRKIFVVDPTERVLALKLVKEFRPRVWRKSGDVTIIHFHERKFPYEAQSFENVDPGFKGKTDNEIYLGGNPVHDRDGNGFLQVLQIDPLLDHIERALGTALGGINEELAASPRQAFDDFLVQTL